MNLLEEPTYHPIVTPKEINETFTESADVTLFKLQESLALDSKSPYSTFQCTILDFARVYRHENVSPIQVARKCLEIIEQGKHTNPPINIVVQYDRIEVERMAEESANRYIFLWK